MPHATRHMPLTISPACLRATATGENLMNGGLTSHLHLLAETTLHGPSRNSVRCFLPQRTSMPWQIFCARSYKTRTIFHWS